jgi:hypothetical protein
MPVLHLRLSQATTTIKLEKQLDAQHLRLKMYAIAFADGNYSDDCIKIDIENATNFLAHDFMNNDRSGNQDHKVSLFVKNETGHRSEIYYPNLNIASSSHIPKEFVVKLYEEDGSTLVTDSHFTALHLYFEYDNDHH